MTTSLYERIGGEAALNAAVDLFYRKVLADLGINHFFDATDMDEQRAKQRAYLAGAALDDILTDPFELRELRQTPRD